MSIIYTQLKVVLETLGALKCLGLNTGDFYKKVFYFCYLSFCIFSEISFGSFLIASCNFFSLAVILFLSLKL